MTRRNYGDETMNYLSQQGSCSKTKER